MPSVLESESDNRLRRGQETRQLLMRAALKLIAEKGIEQVSIREILELAQQKNSSALQYHFGNMRGLIVAIHAEQTEAVRAKRAELLDQLFLATPDPAFRQICGLMIRPSFDLARERSDYRTYVKAFGHQLTLIEESAMTRAAAQGGGGESGLELGRLLKQALPHLSEDVFRQRMDFAVRLCASAMYAQARASNAFRGEQSGFFIEGLIDALMGLLTARTGELLEE